MHLQESEIALVLFSLLRGVELHCHKLVSKFGKSTLLVDTYTVAKPSLSNTFHPMLANLV